MRPIRFRAWDGKTMYWVSEINMLHFEEKGRWFLLDQSGNLICNFVDGILMQFTGLTDKNGKEIYEGDIVKSDDLIGNRIVGYDAPSFYLFKDPGDHVDVDSFSTPLAFEEVIGNVHEHPQLLSP